VARERRSTGPGVPERLCRFLPAEWPGQAVWDAFAAWQAQRRAWAAEHPDSPLGDVVDQLITERATRLHLAEVTSPAPNNPNTDRKERS